MHGRPPDCRSGAKKKKGEEQRTDEVCSTRRIDLSQVQYEEKKRREGCPHGTPLCSVPDDRPGKKKRKGLGIYPLLPPGIEKKREKRE